MESFEQRKERKMRQMTELDRSKKGSIDEPIRELLKAINAKTDMFTTSSCSGRILLLHEPPKAKKKDHEWPLVTHDKADAKEFIKKVDSLKGIEGTVWLRMQTAIVHVACRDLEVAEKLLSVFVNDGWKRSGIFSLANDVMVELLSVEVMEAPVVVDGKVMVDERFVREFIELANNKLRLVHQKIGEVTLRVKKL